MSSQKSFDGVRLHFQSYAPHILNQPLPPIIFLHGIATSHSTWNKVMFKIADKTQRQVYAIDLRNHGKSDWSDEFTLDILMADLEYFLEQQSIKEPILVGHSLGGLIAGCLAMYKPSVVSKVVLVDQNLTIDRSHLKSTIDVIKAMKQISLLPKHFTVTEAQNLLEKELTFYFPTEKYFFYLRKDADGKFHLEFNADAVRKSLEDESLIFIDDKKCNEYLGPALFIYGDKSLMRVEEDEKIPKYFPNVRFSKVKNAHHLLHVEFPEEFVEIVTYFINNQF